MDPNIFESEIFRNIKHNDIEIGGKEFRISTYPYLDIVLTDRCNSHCRFCISDLIHTKLDCNLNVFQEQIMWAVANLGVREVLLLGGEPTISPVLFDMIDFCNSLRLNKICITTNGKRLHQSDEFARKLLSSGITHINLSIMNFNEEHQAFIHGARSNLDMKTLERIYLISMEHNVHVRVNTNVYRGNHDNPYTLLNFYDSVSPLCDSVKFSPLLRTDAFSTIDKVTAFNRDYILPPYEYESLFDAVYDGFSDYPKVINEAVFGFVEYRMVLLETPLILNYNHRGRMMNRAVEHREINNIKLLPNGNLSRSWNREDTEQIIRRPGGR